MRERESVSDRVRKENTHVLTVYIISGEREGYTGDKDIIQGIDNL